MGNFISDNNICVKTQGIAFFDFDGTLTSKDTFFEFGIFTKGKKKLLLSLLKKSPLILFSLFNLYDRGKAKEALFKSLYKGMDYNDFKKNGESFSKKIDSMLNENIYSMAKELKNKGVKLYIVTASISEWVKPWAESHGFEGVIGTEIEIEEGSRHKFLTGNFSTPNCNNKEKKIRIKELFPDLYNYEVWAFGNSKGDREMLSLAHHPLMV